MSPVEPRLDHLVRRLAELDERLRAAPDDEDRALAREALSELALVAEEVQVVGEELAVQRDELRHRSEQAEAEHRRERDLFDHAPAALLATDRRGLIEQANHAAGTLLGQPPEGLCGHALTTFFAEDDRREILRLASRVRRSTVATGVADARRPDGAAVPVSVSVTGDTARSQGPVRLRWALHDLTEVREHEVELQAVIADLHEARRGQEAFLLGVAHDLRGPVTTILTLVEATLAIEASEDTLRATLVHVGDNARTLRRLQTDLVDLERLARNAVRPYRRPADLAELVVDEVKAIDPGEHDVSLELEPVVADVDPGMVRSMVRKVVDNALGHTPPGSSIRVRLEAEDDVVCLTVDDDGPGIAEADRDAVFELFWRGGGGRHSGLGAGLHLVRRFAQLHGGSAVATSSPSGGARFEIRLRRDG